MNIALLALVSFISLGFLTVILQHFFFKEDSLEDDFIVIDKKKEDCCDQYYNNSDMFSAYELMTPMPSCYWVYLKKPEQQIKINDEKLFNKVAIEEQIHLKYRKTFWKFGKKEFIIDYQVLS